MAQEAPLKHLLGYPLLGALLGPRARRFGLCMESPSGAPAHRSRHAPMPLSELERAVLIAAAVSGVTCWSFWVPFGPGRRSARITRRASPA